ncbi:unnamed protein product, partial [Chrysoparadoxa australica]
VEPIAKTRKVLFAESDTNTSSSILTAESGEEVEAGTPLQVFLRVKPLAQGEESALEVEDGGRVRTIPPVKKGKQEPAANSKLFTFDRVFPPTSAQDDVFAAAAAPLVSALLKGESALLFSCGVTNAGKTFTIMGEEGQPGIIPRALDKLTAEASGIGKSVQLSMFEVYQEEVYDLLKDQGKLKIGKRSGRNEVMKLSKHVVGSLEDGVRMVNKGMDSRHKGSTKLNEASSRSHSVCVMELVEDGDLGKIASKSSRSRSNPCLWVVDLAGSERSKRTGVAGFERQAEANNINKSMMTLWQCLEGMRRQHQGNAGVLPPFRNSKLTRLFQNHLASAVAGRTVMIANVNPRKEDFDETQYLLSKASLAQEVRTIVVPVKRGRSLDGANAYDQNGRKLKRGRKADGIGTGSSSKDAGVAGEELAAVKAANLKLVAENLKLLSKNRELELELEKGEERMEAREGEIRTEAAEEMGEMMQDMQEELIRLKESRGSGPTAPQPSAMKVLLVDKLKRCVEEMEDRLAECEAEMVRKDEVHSREVQCLQSALEEESAKLKEVIQCHQEQVMELKKAHEVELKELNEVVKGDEVKEQE